VTTLQSADGRLLRAQRPAGVSGGLGSLFPASFPPMWSDGERWGDDAHLKSFHGIYRSQPIIAAVVDKLTRRIATLPLQVLQRNTDGTRDEVRQEDSLRTLMRRPMPRWSTVHLVSHVAQSLLVNGNAVVAKVRSGDQESPPDMLWPLDWSHLSAYGVQGGTIEYWSTTQFEAQERFLAAADTIHFAWPAPEGGEVGVSPLEKLGVTIRIEDAAQRHQTSMFRNGIRPSAAVTVEDPNITSDKLALAGEIVKAAHKGVDKAGSWVWMGANAKVQPLSLSPVEAALMDQRQRNWEEVAAVYDMAGPLSGDLTHGTYSNVQVILDSLYRDVVPPWTTLIVDTMQAQLIDPEPAWLDHVVRFDFSDKLRGDPLVQAQVDKSDVEAGIRTRDEAREARGLAGMGGAAAKLTLNANNQAPVDQAGASIGSPPS
jgi:HK97 family phage portal protein